MKLFENIKLATPYMIRNDGKLIECSPMHPYIKYFHESIGECINKLSTKRLSSLYWFYENTNKEKTKETIEIVLKYFLKHNLIENIQINIPENTYLSSTEEIEDFINILNADTNQEFLRMRTSSLLFGGNSRDVYFRISSIDFNWFNIIWELVYKYRNQISNITICKDSNTFGNSFNTYKVGNVHIDHYPTEEFLTLNGNPIMEEYTNKIEAIKDACKKMRIGKSVSESYDYLHPRYAHSIFQKQVKENLKENIYTLLHK